MGQRFYLLNLDNAGEVESSPGGSKFGEFYCSAMTAGTPLLRALWNPDESERRVEVLPLNEAEGFPFPLESNENSSSGFLNQLSNEVLDLIFDQVHDILDLISLMVTCQRYWEFGRRYLERVIEDSVVVSWAGNRLILLGNYAELEDLPQGMLTDSEVERIRLYCRGKRHYDLKRTIPILQKPPPSWSSATMGQIISPWDLVSRLRSMTVDAKRIFRYYDNIYDVLEKLILIRDLDPADFFDGHMVFRNLTTKEYVRGDAIKNVPNIPDMSWRRPLRLEFEHVLYIRTTWSSDPSLSYSYDGPLQIHRGVWAGHRFDVTRIGRVVDEAGVAVDDWKDVTEEVLNEVVEIWEN